MAECTALAVLRPSEDGVRAVVAMFDAEDLLLVRDVLIEQLRSVELPEDRFAGYVPQMVVGYAANDDELATIMRSAQMLVGELFEFSSIGVFGVETPVSFALEWSDDETASSVSDDDRAKMSEWSVFAEASGKLPDAYRPASSDDVPEGQACGNCMFYNENVTRDTDDGAVEVFCDLWSAYVRGDFYCDRWKTNVSMNMEENKMDEIVVVEETSEDDVAEAQTVTELAIVDDDGNTYIIADLADVTDPQTLVDAAAAAVTDPMIKVMLVDGAITAVGLGIDEARKAALDVGDERGIGIVQWEQMGPMSVSQIDDDNENAPDSETETFIAAVVTFDVDGDERNETHRAEVVVDPNNVGTSTAALRQLCDGLKGLHTDEQSDADNALEMSKARRKYKRKRMKKQRAAVAASADIADDDIAEWEGVLVIEGTPSGDGRQIQAGALTWRDLPMSLMLMTKNPQGGNGHDGAEVCGTIQWIERRGNEIWGGGELDLALESGKQAQGLLARKTLRGVSADIDSVEVEYANPKGGLDDIYEGNLTVTSGRLMGATLCPFPAFQEAQVYLVDQKDQNPSKQPEIDLVASGKLAVRRETQVVSYLPVNDDDVLVASGAPVAPPQSWFERPVFDGPTPVRVSDDGHVFGHVAAWGTCHIGYAQRCVSVPKSKTNYAAFRVGRVMTAEGVEVASGPIVLDTDHADLGDMWRSARDHYAHTGCAVADVNIGEDQYGVWIAGAVRPDATSSQIRALRASDISPDWRTVNGKPLEMVGLLVVNNSGFKVPQSLAASAGSRKRRRRGGDRRVQPGVLAYRESVETKQIEALVAAGSVRQAVKDAAVVDEVAELKARVAELSAFLRPMKEAKAKESAVQLAEFKPAEKTPMQKAKRRLALAQAKRLAQG
jgi:hypothetical protein